MQDKLSQKEFVTIDILNIKTSMVLYASCKSSFNILFNLISSFNSLIGKYKHTILKTEKNSICPLNFLHEGKFRLLSS